VTIRRGKTREQLLDNLKETRGYWKLREEALDHTIWRTPFGRGCGPVVRIEMGYEVRKKAAGMHEYVFWG
jgi:hypothetical protein